MGLTGWNGKGGWVANDLGIEASERQADLREAELQMDVLAFSLFHSPGFIKTKDNKNY